MHGDPDDGYPVAPQPGFAPFTMMLQRHVPWADERLRGSYYQRAWQVSLWLPCRSCCLHIYKNINAIACTPYMLVCYAGVEP